MLLSNAAQILWLSPPSPHRPTHTHKFAQPAVYPEFPVSRVTTNEGVYQAVYLSAPLLSRPQTPAFKGSIEVDISAEDLPSDDYRQKADFGKRYLTHLSEVS